MKTTKIVSILSAAVMALGLATACSSGKDSSTADPAGTTAAPAGTTAAETTAAAKPVSLTFLTWDGTKNAAGGYAVQDAIDAYTKENPNVTVKLDIQAENDSQAFLQKLDLLQLSGNPAEIIAQPSARTYNMRAAQGFFYPMNDFLAAEGVKYEDLYASNLAVDGTYYALPQGGAQIYGVFINKKMLDAAKLTVPEMGWTWDDYADYAAKMTTGDGANKIYGSYLHLSWSEFLREGLFSTTMDNPYIKEDGTSNMDSKYFGEWLEFVNKMQTDGTTTPLSDIKANNLNYRDVFFQGKCAMLPIGEWIFANIADKEKFPHDFDIVFVPSPKFSDGKVGVTQAGGSSCLAIGAKTGDAEAQAAYNFIRWYSNSGAPFLGNVPADRTVDIEAAQRERCNKLGLTEAGFDVDNFIKVYLDERVVTNEIARDADLFDAIDKVYQAEAELYLLGNQDLATTLKNFQEQGAAIMSR